ncbi:MAG TPA: glycogen debranching N-terminal domain-containing protein, partial [Actinomycetota bacterium]|nr:glycogen debranching N-terminal domain-containing protein [Actinomycetota bacterium]
MAPDGPATDAALADERDAVEHPRLRPEVTPTVITELSSRVLATKEGEMFLYSDTEGNLDDRTELGLGLYFEDTRFLSHLRMRVSGRDPVLLSSSSERGYMSYVDLTNPDLYDGEELAIPQQTLNIRRIRTINGRLFERIRVKNYNAFPVRLTIELTFAADFADLFGVRGIVRESRGHFRPPDASGRTITFSYVGLDDVPRETRIEFGSEPEEVGVRGDVAWARFVLYLSAHQTKLVSMTATPVVESRSAPSTEFDVAVHQLRRSYEEWERRCTNIKTDNELFDQLLTRGIRDLRALYTPVDGGSVLAAGIPWYVSPFGRDALITSHQLLMINPDCARDALDVLARLQGTKVDPWRDEEPGKILHEVRRGELARSGEIPHTPYYGSVDSTPWFLVVLAQYFRWTGDVDFVKTMMPAAEAALAWIDEYGDRDGDGFVEYESRSPRGLRNQGWKDSWDSVVHADGRLAEPPIALAEVQAYVYLAKTRVADLYEALGDAERAAELRRQAIALRARFNEAFWIEEEQYFAEALDRDKRQVRSIVSNAGHGLYCDVVDPEKA